MEFDKENLIKIRKIAAVRLSGGIPGEDFMRRESAAVSALVKQAEATDLKNALISL